MSATLPTALAACIDKVVGCPAGGAAAKGQPSPLNRCATGPMCTGRRQLAGAVALPPPDECDQRYGRTKAFSVPCSP